MAEKRDKMLTIPVSEAEIEAAKLEADKLGISVAAFVRLLLKNWSDGITFRKDKNQDVQTP